MYFRSSPIQFIFEKTLYYTSFPSILLGVLQIIFLAIALSIVIESLSVFRKLKSKFVSSYIIPCDEVFRIFLLNESIIRYYIYFLLVLFEFVFFSCQTINSVMYAAYLHKPDSIQPKTIQYNCTLAPGTLLAQLFDPQLVSVIYSCLDSLARFAFAIIIWLFFVTLVHLSFGVTNKINPRILICLILYGILQALVILPFLLSEYLSLFGIIALSFINQMTIVISVFSAHHFFNLINPKSEPLFVIRSAGYPRRKRLKNQFRCLIIFLIIIFECNAIKDLVFYNSYVMLESLSLNTCWFHSTFDFHRISFSLHSMSTMSLMSSFCLVITRFFELLFSFGILLVNAYFSGKYLYGKCCRAKYRFLPEDFPNYSIFRNNRD